MITAGFCGCSRVLGGDFVDAKPVVWICPFFYHLRCSSLNPSENRLMKNQAKSNYFLYSAWVFMLLSQTDRGILVQRNLTSFQKVSSLQWWEDLSADRHWYEARTFAVSTGEKSISERAFTLHINPAWYGPHFVSFLTWLMFYFMLRFAFLCITS